MTPGQASDTAAYGDLIDEDAPDPVAMLAAKGDDSDSTRGDPQGQGIDPVIPTKSNRKIQRPVCRQTYAHRNRIERFFNKIKHSGRVATRHDKLASSLLGFIQRDDQDQDQVRPHDLGKHHAVLIKVKGHSRV